MYMYRPFQILITEPVSTGENVGLIVEARRIELDIGLQQ